jgi:twinkle protein
MDYAVYVNDVEHIVLDNLQFMLGVGAGRGFERFDQQERALDLFRQFATSKNVHITLVVHPRKEAENVNLGISSVFGTAKATQEADNVIIVQATSEVGAGGGGHPCARNVCARVRVCSLFFPCVGSVCTLL